MSKVLQNAPRILSTFIKLPFVIKIIVLSIFEWSFKTGFTVSLFQASSLTHAKDLTDFAQKWADHLVATNGFQHSDCNHRGQKLGENIAMKWSSRPDAYTGGWGFIHIHIS